MELIGLSLSLFLFDHEADPALQPKPKR